MLHVVATPIGNLGDLSARALECLRSASLIACEDTRRTWQLLTHFGIPRPEMLSYRQGNEARVAETVGSPPNSRTVPAVGRMRPISILIVVVFPAPFVPRNPVTSPLPSERVRLSTALSEPNDRLTPSNSKTFFSIARQV